VESAWSHELGEERFIELRDVLIDLNRLA